MNTKLLPEVQELYDTREIIQKDIDSKKDILGGLQRRLIEIQSSCKHDWSIPNHSIRKFPERVEKVVDITHETGSSGESISIIPARTEHTWERTCLKCHKVETTHNFTKQNPIPKWS